ncbi:uncharacterized protein LOC132744494 isoform X1 [Ruditapes philippinarum]|uniref:uncharacterized protein LOC132744494 isoform X1 n=1 Tax=Ruditapes philippinarum TaxID=129788 RepID=UPI00295A976D|nr:uncharacterized protein LOC132744494 isoform X1 [Ruditapes philippinarum]XP_060589201.1 uncharacterized protein LOC132744494 isoform X1 [Ruditapes philippinarum]XP_060589202.1 uncharacterized protein LOC132744494 isoform X1 [Ruditapes philippinarum]XP_060589203.1 uncharacterized protein LOC132744494 isoform X1 [Ruditapes philippinarum]XP_060589204.1 uncharacterized protein LOC132744494 isoform X1 [Ruditapes philippinarum]XP_060589205.1 uncharacterized protein LOC132744494 isoform X1 [Rudita
MGGFISNEDVREKEYKHSQPNQQFQRQRRQRFQQRPISSLTTQELLEYLEGEFLSKVDIIRNMKKEKNFDEGGRKYICDVMIETENNLGKFNRGMNSGRSADQIRQTTTSDEEIQSLNCEINNLRIENSRLQHEKKHLDGLLTTSMKRPSASNHAQSLSQGYKTDRNEKTDNSKGLQDLKQRLAICSHELDEERERQVKAVSYIEHLKKKCNEFEKEKNEIQMRLSKVAGDRLTDNNPAIADLSDPNRPTKIGEMYSEVYDNEWTDAFEALTNAGYDEREAIDTLRLTLLNVIQFCSRKSDSLIKRTEEAVNILFEEYKATEQKSNKRHLTMPRKSAEHWGKIGSKTLPDPEDIFLQNKWKPKDNSEANANTKYQTIAKPKSSDDAIANQLRKFRKEVAVSMVPLVEKAYISASWNEECIHDLKPFIRKCLLLGWMMVVQSPPMTFAEFKPNEEFRKEIYKEYTTRGSHIDYEVWPALLLNQDGPVVGKGVAQGKKAT